MIENWSQLDGGRFLADLYQKDSLQAAFLQKLITAINKLGNTLGANPVGEVHPPPPIDNINVKASGEMLHVSLDHTKAVNRNIHYFVEVANEPNFIRPLVVHQGTSRSSAPIPLPSKDDSGNAINYYVRAYAQYPGSKPSPPTVFGGPLNAASVTLQGPTKMTLLSSTGSGTAAASGQQGGYGFGKYQTSEPIQRVGSSTVQGNIVGTAALISPAPAHQSYRPGSNPLTAHDAGANVTITVANFTNNFAGNPVSVIGAPLTGYSYGTLYYVYYQETNPPSGGSPTFLISTTKVATLANDNYVYVGSITTPVAGGSDTIGNNDGGTGAQYGIQANVYAGKVTVTGTAWTNTNNAIDQNTSTAASQTATNPTTILLVQGFSGVAPYYTSIVLNVRSSIGNATSTEVKLQYSIDGGSTFTPIYDVFSASRALTVDSVTLSNSQNLSLVQVQISVTGGSPAAVNYYEAWIAVTS